MRRATMAAGLMTAAIVTTAANAELYANVGIVVRRAGEAVWGTEATWAANTTYELGVQVEWSGMHAFRGVTFQVLGVGTAADDQVRFAEGSSGGRIEGWRGPTAASNFIFASASGFRIDAANDASNSNSYAGATFSQDDTRFADRTNPVVPFRFQIITGDAPAHQIDIGLPRSQISRGLMAGVVEVPSGFATELFSTFDLYGARIVIPAPGSGAILAAAACCGVRRKRRA